MTFLPPAPLTGYGCQNRYHYEFQGERRERDCGSRHCRACMAKRKRDAAGRAAAEAYMSHDVVAITLTYREPWDQAKLNAAKDAAKQAALQRKLARMSSSKRAATLEQIERERRYDAMRLEIWDKRREPFMTPETRNSLWEKRARTPDCWERVSGAYEFVPQHRRWMLARLRSRFQREAERKLGLGHVERIKDKAERKAAQARVDEIKTRVSVFGCGERGSTSTYRVHWHMVLFFSGPSGLRSTPRQADGKPGREIVDFWPHGFVNIDVLPSDPLLRVRAINYCVKYMSKTVGVDVEALHVGPLPEHERQRRQRQADSPWRKRGGLPVANPSAYEIERRKVDADAQFFMSSKRPLGVGLLEMWAEQQAQAGVPLSSFYTVPGVETTRTKSKTKLYPLGRSRVHYALAYRRAWERWKPGVRMPVSEFTKRHDPEYVQIEAKPPRELSSVSTITRAGDGQAGELAVYDAKRLRGFLVVNKNGFAQYWREGEAKPRPVAGDDIRHIERDLPVEVHLALERWLADKRPSDWLSGPEREVAEAKKHLAQCEAILKFSNLFPKAGPDHRPGFQGYPGLLRNLIVNGAGHIEGVPVWNGALGKHAALVPRKKPYLKLRLDFRDGEFVPSYRFDPP